MVVVLLARRAGGAAENLTAATIGGVDVISTLVEALGGGQSNNASAHLVWGNVPDGESGDVALTFSGGQNELEIYVYSISILGSLTAQDSNTSTDTDPANWTFTRPTGRSAYFGITYGATAVHTSETVGATEVGSPAAATYGRATAFRYIEGGSEEVDDKLDAVNGALVQVLLA